MASIGTKIISRQDYDFFILLRAGLWGDSAEPISVHPDWEHIYHLSCEQAVLGVVAEGIEVVRKTFPSILHSEATLRFLVGATEICKSNIERNSLQGRLLQLFDEHNITAFVIKGLGLAQNYPNPAVRITGDIDFLLPTEDYQKAKLLLSPLASHISNEYKKNMHWGGVIDGIEVELHGTALSFFLDKADRMLLDKQARMFAAEDFIVKTADNGMSIFKTPGYQMDIYYTFFHILKHLAQGLGIRQLCDLAEMLKAYKKHIAVDGLELDLKEMGLTKYWKIMMSFCVDLLGLPAEYAPLFEPSYSRYDDIMWNHIRSIGNFGTSQNERLQEYGKLQSYWHRVSDLLSFAPISHRLVVRRLWEMNWNYLKSFSPFLRIPVIR